MDAERNGWIAAGAVLGGLAVVLGAFGAHALEGRLSPEQEGWWETGVLYHALHASALVLWGLDHARRRRSAAPGWCFLVGAAIFGGTLYGLALGGPRWLGAVTPIGGTLLIVGWGLFALQALRPARSAS